MKKLSATEATGRPVGYLQCGKAVVPYNNCKKCWVAPGGKHITSRYQADALGWKINDLMEGGQ